MRVEDGGKPKDPGPEDGKCGPRSAIPVVRVDWDVFDALTDAVWRVTVPTKSMPITEQGFENLVLWCEGSGGAKHEIAVVAWP